jgi:hypothetical protein
MFVPLNNLFHYLIISGHLTCIFGIYLLWCLRFLHGKNEYDCLGCTTVYSLVEVFWHFRGTAPYKHVITAFSLLWFTTVKNRVLCLSLRDETPSNVNGDMDTGQCSSYGRCSGRWVCIANHIGIHSHWCIIALGPVVYFRILRCLLQAVVQLLHLSLITMFSWRRFCIWCSSLNSSDGSGKTRIFSCTYNCLKEVVLDLYL